LVVIPSEAPTPVGAKSRDLLSSSATSAVILFSVSLCFLCVLCASVVKAFVFLCDLQQFSAASAVILTFDLADAS